MLSANGVGALLGALTVATFGSRVRPRRMVFGGISVFSAMLLLLAVIEAGVVSHALGVRLTMAIGALVCALAALLTWLSVRKTPATRAGAA